MDNNGCLLLGLDDLIGGDVLLCFTAKGKSPFRRKIREITESKYTHAAINLGNGRCLESTVLHGVRKAKVADLVADSSHVAVFRHPEAWGTDRIGELRSFADCLIMTRAKYNIRGVMEFKNLKAAHAATVNSQLQSYFSGKTVPESPLKRQYFCSELVADCFRATGFISPSAAMVYRSRIISPGELGRDATYGTFVGYLRSSKRYRIPMNDEFISRSTFSEIFG